MVRITFDFLSNMHDELHISNKVSVLLFQAPQTNNSKVYKDAFALFDKRGTGRIPPEALGDLLRAIGQNPTLGEIDELERSVGSDFDFETFVKIVTRPDGFKDLGEPEDYVRGFQVFDKDQTGYIGVGELRYILTSLGEKLTDTEVDELLRGVNVSKDGNVDYVEFVKTILSQQIYNTK